VASETISLSSDYYLYESNASLTFIKNYFSANTINTYFNSNLLFAQLNLTVTLTYLYYLLSIINNLFILNYNYLFTVYID
jgi:hypothetical protein